MTYIKKINWRLLNASVYLTLAMGYLYPLEISVNDSVRVGFPSRYFTIYENASQGINLLSSSHVSLGQLLINVIFYYFLLVAVNQLVRFIKKRRNHVNCIQDQSKPS